MQIRFEGHSDDLVEVYRDSQIVDEWNIYPRAGSFAEIWTLATPDGEQARVRPQFTNHWEFYLVPAPGIELPDWPVTIRARGAEGDLDLTIEVPDGTVLVSPKHSWED